MLGTRPETIGPVVSSALETALRLDPNLVEARSLLAFAMVLKSWDWSGAKLAFDAAFATHRHSPILHWRYAIFLLAPHGRFAEALDEMDRALAVDPLSAITVYARAQILRCHRNYEQAEAECEHVLMIDPEYKLAQRLLGMIYQQTGRYAQAVSLFEEIVGSSQSDLRSHSRLAAAYAHVGRRHETLSILAELLRDHSGRVHAWLIGWIYLNLDDLDEAMKWLEIGIETHDPNMIWLKVHPDFDALRSHPKFNDALRHVGLSECSE